MKVVFFRSIWLFQLGKSLWSNKYEAHLRDCGSIPNKDPAATSLQKSVIVHFFFIIIL